LEKDEIPISFAIDVVLQAIVSRIGGGHPDEIDYPKIKVKYIDFDYHISVNTLKTMTQVNHLIKTIELRLGSPKNKSESPPVKELKVAGTEEFGLKTKSLRVKGDFKTRAKVGSLQVVSSFSKFVETNQMSVAKESSKKVDAEPLDIVKVETISAILSQLDLIEEYSCFVGSSPLELRVKPDKRKVILDLLSKLDEIDDF